MKSESDSRIAETNFEELLTVDEVASLLKVRPGWIAQRIHSKRLPFLHIKVGVYPRFPVSGVRKFLDEQLKQGAEAR